MAEPQLEDDQNDNVEGSVVEPDESPAKMTLGRLRSHHRKEVQEFQNAWKSKLKRAKKGEKRTLQREKKAAEEELRKRQKREIQDLTAERREKERAEIEREEKEEQEARQQARLRLQQQAEEENRLRHEREAQERAEREAEAALILDERKQENEKLAGILDPLGLAIFDIPGDGQCMYRALSHQLQVLDENDVRPFEELRVLCSAYMRDHPDEFRPFLVNSDGDLMSDDEYDSYCSRVAGMGSSVLWGGHHELVALARALRLSICVYSANSETQTISGGADTSEESPRLRLSYHHHKYGLGEHYDSVVPRAFLVKDISQQQGGRMKKKKKKKRRRSNQNGTGIVSA